MTPSQRIQEIINEMEMKRKLKGRLLTNSDKAKVATDAIIQYLDEEKRGSF